MIVTDRQGVHFSLLYILIALVSFAGLFVPLMDNDAAHHANIALRMYLTGDYITLVDHAGDYLDKPHLHFWLAAMSYEIFGVTGFAYKFPSFLFGIAAVYATYRLGRILYDEYTGKLAALVLATAFSFLLALTDVRMDAILTSCVILTTWMGVEWVNKKTVGHIIAIALFAALGFSTKGHIALVVPALAILIYVLQQQKSTSIIHWHVIVFAIAFFIFISPVLYSYYMQFDMHPEKVIRGEAGRSGVAFILWNQNIERISGDSFGSDASGDKLFFFHTFLWAFAPWSVLAYMAIFNSIKKFRNRKTEWATAGTILLFALLISFAGFKLPHYLNIILPLAAILTASFIINQKETKIKYLAIIQYIICLVALLLIVSINLVSFPMQNLWIVAGLVLLVIAASYIFISKINAFSRLVNFSAITAIIIFYLLNLNFYPQLLTYQAGNELAQKTKHIPPANVYYWQGIYSSSYDFYSSELRKPYDSSMLLPTPAWIMIPKNEISELISQGMELKEVIANKDYEITKLDLRFVNPATRNKQLDTLMLVRVK